MDEQDNEVELRDKDVFPDDFFKYDISKYKKYMDNFVEDIKRAYNQQVRDIVSVINKNPGMRIVHCGMGGSAIAAEIMGAYLSKEDFILESVTDYEIKGKLTNKDLVIISSYSGNTEEALSCYRQARRFGSQVILITSGGKLTEAASAGRVPLIKLPQGYPPRAALPFMFFTLLKVLEETAIITRRISEVQDLVNKLDGKALETFAIGLSEKLYGKVPLIYASSYFYPVAYRWKTQINENAKSVAFSNKFPELNHNEITGFETKNAIFHVVMLSTDSDPSRVRKRMQISKDLLQKNGVDVTELHVKGDLLNKIFTAVYAGDLTSYFLALRYRTDPLPVNTIEKLKREMGPFI